MTSIAETALLWRLPNSLCFTITFCLCSITFSRTIFSAIDFAWSSYLTITSALVSSSFKLHYREDLKDCSHSMQCLYFCLLLLADIHFCRIGDKYSHISKKISAYKKIFITPSQYRLRIIWGLKCTKYDKKSAFKQLATIVDKHLHLNQTAEHTSNENLQEQAFFIRLLLFRLVFKLLLSY